MSKVTIDIASTQYSRIHPRTEALRDWCNTISRAVERKFGEHAHIVTRKAGYYPSNESMYFVYTLTFESQRAFNVFKLKYPDRVSILDIMHTTLEERFKEDGIKDTDEFISLLYEGV